MFTTDNIRPAGPEEINFYENNLYPLQDAVFTMLQTDRFYLSGGTCLSRFYYYHRYSEDLDFIFNGSQYLKEEFEVESRNIINRLQKQYEIEITLNGEFFKRGFIQSNKIELKIEFIYENYPHIGEFHENTGIIIDSKENIGTNKITAIYDRKTAKDFVDLYYLLQDMDLSLLTEWAKYKVVPLDYEGTIIALSNSKIEGTALLKKNMSPDAMNQFAHGLIGDLISNARSS